MDIYILWLLANIIIVILSTNWCTFFDVNEDYDVEDFLGITLDMTGWTGLLWAITNTAFIYYIFLK